MIFNKVATVALSFSPKKIRLSSSNLVASLDCIDFISKCCNLRDHRICKLVHFQRSQFPFRKSWANGFLVSSLILVCSGHSIDTLIGLVRKR
ncbi:hypothetical protein OIU79_022247 [Salix purpurea]|uniref:Uncharacterized protein n=1 Tax=Salix purpurea TaxID=77065 RepID=A0A9Q0WFD8_SALPP|nr:hypothetical protein OIU79_022247 [Salix purpurea]